MPGKLNTVPSRELLGSEDWMIDVDESRATWFTPEGLHSEELVAALESLNEPYRSVLEMRYWGRMTYQQIAKEHGWPNRTWTSTYHKRAVAMLRESLSQDKS